MTTQYFRGLEGVLCNNGLKCLEKFDWGVDMKIVTLENQRSTVTHCSTTATTTNRLEELTLEDEKLTLDTEYFEKWTLDTRPSPSGPLLLYFL